MSSQGALEAHLRARRAQGRPLLVPYVTGGITDGWTDYLRAYVTAGADAIEVGLPFSDPMLDGPTIQAAGHRALARGSTASGLLDELSTLDLGVPLVVMTYSNIAFRHGIDAFLARLAGAGVHGLVVPDLPCDELDPLAGAAAAAGIELALLAAPATTPSRLQTIAQRSRGFVYGVTVMGTTGEREALAASARAVATRVRELTTRPVLLGFGITTPRHAAEAAAHADGVVVASTLMRQVLAGEGPSALARSVAELRAGLDGAVAHRS